MGIGDRFVRFVKKASPALHEMAQVHAPLATSYCQAELARGVAAKTYNHTLIHLRSVFHVLRKEAGIAENPYAGYPAARRRAVFRKPFSIEELSLLEEKAKADPFILHPSADRDRHVHRDASRRFATSCSRDCRRRSTSHRHNPFS